MQRKSYNGRWVGGGQVKKESIQKTRAEHGNLKVQKMNQVGHREGPGADRPWKGSRGSGVGRGGVRAERRLRDE